MDWTWEVFRNHCRQNTLKEYLLVCPKKRWAKKPHYGAMLIHEALGLGTDNNDAIYFLIANGVDTNGFRGLDMLMCEAIRRGREKAFSYLCASNKNNLQVPLQQTLLWKKYSFAKILIANGYRVNEKTRYCTQELMHFQQGVINCRRVVIAFYRIKTRKIDYRWDRFLLAQIGLCVWITRTDDNW